jgi:molecular chaperone DnaK (HSP70)
VEQATVASSAITSSSASASTIEHTHLIEGVKEKFRGLDLYKVAGDYHKRPLVDAAHRARITELTELIDRMGPVNVDAMREHAEAEERHTYYAGQKADLEKALDDLEKAIQQMNKESKRLFKARPSTASTSASRPSSPACSAAARPSCASPTRTTCWRPASRSSPSPPARSSATSS